METEIISTARKRLLDSAEELFHARGYKAITMRDIAREVGIKQSSLYYHFPDGKEQLFVEVMERQFEHHYTGLTTSIEATSPDLTSQLEVVACWFATQPALNLLSMMHLDMPELSDKHKGRLFQSMNQAIFQPIKQLFETAQNRGESRLINPGLLTGSFLAMIDGFAQARHLHITPMSTHAMAAEMISVWVEGLKIRP